jgi:hypothetical protein
MQDKFFSDVEECAGSVFGMAELSSCGNCTDWWEEDVLLV